MAFSWFSGPDELSSALWSTEVFSVSTCVEVLGSDSESAVAGTGVDTGVDTAGSYIVDSTVTGFALVTPALKIESYITSMIVRYVMLTWKHH